MDPKPDFAWADRDTTGLADLALKLSEAPDDDAVAQLVNAARGDAGLLRDAAQRVRFDGTIEEVRADFLANRLLLTAAESGSSVEPLSAEQDTWFTRVESLDFATPREAFALLVDLVPELQRVERELNVHLESTERGDSALWDWIARALRGVVGPAARSDDPLITSLTAYGMCRLHLANVAGMETS